MFWLLNTPPSCGQRSWEFPCLAFYQMSTCMECPVLFLLDWTTLASETIPTFRQKGARTPGFTPTYQSTKQARKSQSLGPPHFLCKLQIEKDNYIIVRLTWQPDGSLWKLWDSLTAPGQWEKYYDQVLLLQNGRSTITILCIVYAIKRDFL